MEIAEKDITQLLEGDKILIEVSFEDVHNGELVARYQTPSHGQLRIWIEPEKYRGVPVEPIVKGSQFRSRDTDQIFEVYEIDGPLIYYFSCSAPLETDTTDERQIAYCNWERIK